MNKCSKILTLFFAVVIVVGGIYFSRAPIANETWDQFRLAEISFFLDPTAERAFAIGNYYFNWNLEGAYDLEKARSYYQEALTRDPHISGPWYQLARIDFLEGEFNDAIFKLNEHITLHPDPDEPFFNRAHYVRGLTYGYVGRYESAEKDFLELIARTDEKAHWAYYVDLGWFYFSQGKFNELGSVSAEGLERYPDNPWILSNLGLALMNLNHAEALPVLTFALEEAKKLTLGDWERAYPGNDPRLATQGLSEMRAVIEENLALVVDKQKTPKP